MILETIKQAAVSAMVSALISGVGVFYLQRYLNDKHRESEQQPAGNPAARQMCWRPSAEEPQAGCCSGSTSALSEAGEEFLEAVAQPVLQRATYDRNARFDMSEALYSALIGAALGAVGGGVELDTVPAEAAVVADLPNLPLKSLTQEAEVMLESLNLKIFN